MNSKSLKEKICLITGASTGIGKATAAGLASLGLSIVMVCRDTERGEKARRDIIKKSKKRNVHLYTADLSSKEDIRKLSIRIHKKFDGIDILINNAGIITNKREITAEGMEYQFAVNYISNFLLTHLLLDLLLKRSPSRIINVSSHLHKGVGINFNDLQSENKYDPHKVYGITKLAQILFTHKLSELLTETGITVNSLTPGTVATNLLSDYKSRSRKLGFLNRIKNASPEEGAETSIYLAASKEVEGVTGKYFVNKKSEKTSMISYDQKTIDRLWNESLKLSGISEYWINN